MSYLCSKDREEEGKTRRCLSVYSVYPQSPQPRTHKRHGDPQNSEFGTLVTLRSSDSVIFRCAYAHTGKKYGNMKENMILSVRTEPDAHCKLRLDGHGCSRQKFTHNRSTVVENSNSHCRHIEHNPRRTIVSYLHR